MTMFYIYLLFTIPNLVPVCFLVGFMSILILICATLNRFERSEFTIGKIQKYSILIILITSLLIVLIPSEKSLVKMIGAYMLVNSVDSIKNIPNADKLPSNVVNALNKFLEDYHK